MPGRSADQVANARSSALTCSIVVRELTKVYREIDVLPIPQWLNGMAAMCGFGVTLRAKSERGPALNNVSFSIGQGERVGIIGENGAGKSTLVHILAGVSKPTKGQIEIYGRVHSILTLGLGLRDDLTGRENLYIDGELQGKTRAETREKIVEMIDFSELGEFIDRPVRTYSSGMKARLAFTGLAYIDPEILVIDEVLSVGDHRFSKKATRVIRDLCDHGKIVLVVSHSLDFIEQMCSRCLWLDHGRVIADADPVSVTSQYREEIRRREEAELMTKFAMRNAELKTEESSVLKVGIRGITDRDAKAVFISGEDVCIEITLTLHQPLTTPDIRLIVECLDGLWLSENYLSDVGDVELNNKTGEAKLDAVMAPLVIAPGFYRLRVEVLERNAEAESVIAAHSTVFKVVADGARIGGKPALHYPITVAETKWRQ